MDFQELLEPTHPQVCQRDANDVMDEGEPPLHFLPPALELPDVFQLSAISDSTPCQPSKAPFDQPNDFLPISIGMEDSSSLLSIDWRFQNSLCQHPCLDAQLHIQTPPFWPMDSALCNYPSVNTASEQSLQPLHLQRQSMKSDSTLMPSADLSLDRQTELDYLQCLSLYPHYLQSPQEPEVNAIFGAQTAEQPFPTAQQQQLDSVEERDKYSVFSLFAWQPPYQMTSSDTQDIFNKGQEGLKSPGFITLGSALSDHEYRISRIEDQAHDQRGDKGRRVDYARQKHTKDGMDIRTNGASKSKRPRKALQLKEKLQIIDHWEKKTQSYPETAKHFHVPRTTVYGIIKDKAALKQLGKDLPRQGPILETSRTVESDYAVLEKLLTAWILDLESRSIPVSGHKITTQAFEIHRMLSGLLSKPLPPCQFSSGWLKNFKKRQQISLKRINRDNTNDDDIALAFKELHAKLDGFNMRSIYWCDMTNMFLSAIPTRIFQSGAQENQETPMDTASVSVLLCSNVIGSRNVRPLVILRHSPGIIDIEKYGDIVVDAGVENLTTSLFKNWLTKLGNENALLLKVALLVDEAVWRVLEVDSRESTYTAGGVTVIKVPRELTALMPMSDGVSKELKANYHILLTEARKAAISRSTSIAQSASVSQLSDIAFEDHLNLIPEAWNRVSSLTLKHSFKRFIPPTTHLPVNDGDPQHADSIQERLKEILQDVFPKIPGHILEYYSHHDRDIGPSGFLRAKIQEMQRQPDYESFFGALSFGEVRVVSERLKFSTISPHLEDLGFVHMRAESERPKVTSEYPKDFFFVEPYTYTSRRFDGRRYNANHELRAALKRTSEVEPDALRNKTLTKHTQQ